jgi:hypothetical protein
MDSGYSTLSRYGFLGAGFWVVMVTGIGLALVYAVGHFKGKRAAQQWVNSCMLVAAVGGIADIAWAVISGQWRSFMLQFGFSPIAEMLILAALFIGTMWFMATRYIAGIEE